MKKIILSVFLMVGMGSAMKAQESYGKTLNLGVGLGFYGMSVSPSIMANYEFDLFKNATLAPMVGFSTYRYKNWYYNPDNNRYYGYRETLIPLGAKFHYYFDELFNAGEKWDFYAAGSAGFALYMRSWEAGYTGYGSYATRSPIFFDGHIGAEMHLNEKTGLFLDLSSGMNTFGLAIHL